ncbi:hypothetical protein NC652_023559 [Populus alba x Populus x berolinensis]|nr:hypothetical protein NC652_023559 [Populus alba x Populus x berolinensis]
MMQRSYCNNSIEGKPDFLFQPRFDTLLESPNYQSQALSSPENNFIAGQLRRVYSTSDLQFLDHQSHATERSLSSPLATESSFISALQT